MKMSKVGWFEAAGLALVGGLGAYAVSKYMHRPLGDQIHVGDVASVPLGAIQAVNGAPNVLNLTSIAVGGLVPVTVTSIADAKQPQGTVNVGAALITVTFASSTVMALSRAGKPVT